MLEEDLSHYAIPITLEKHCGTLHLQFSPAEVYAAQIVMFWRSIYKKCVALVGYLHCKVDYNRNSIVKLLYTYFRNSSFREHIGATIIHIGL